MTGPRRFILVIDRIEGATVILEADDGRVLSVARRLLPSRPTEGMVLRVDSDSDGNPIWKSAVVDDKERERRLKELETRMEKLRRDPGGDIEL